MIIKIFIDEKTLDTEVIIKAAPDETDPTIGVNAAGSLDDAFDPVDTDGQAGQDPSGLGRHLYSARLQLDHFAVSVSGPKVAKKSLRPLH